MSVRVVIFRAHPNTQRCEHPMCCYLASSFILKERVVMDGGRMWFVDGFCSEHKKPGMINQWELDDQLYALDVMES